MGFLLASIIFLSHSLWKNLGWFEKKITPPPVLQLWQISDAWKCKRVEKFKYCQPLFFYNVGHCHKLWPWGGIINTTCNGACLYIWWNADWTMCPKRKRRILEENSKQALPSASLCASNSSQIWIRISQGLSFS